MNGNKNTKTLLTALTTIMAFGLLTVSAPVLAQTPDGLTPANEGICDDLAGEKSGLYGLCVAYCEAQDLQETPPNADDIDDATKAALHAEKLLGVFDKKAGPDGPRMPCVTYENLCPWTLDELEAIGSYGLTRTQQDTETSYIFFRDHEGGFFVDPSSGLLTQISHSVKVNATSLGGSAEYRFFSETFDPRVTTGNIVRTKALTFEEAYECANQIRDNF